MKNKKLIKRIIIISICLLLVASLGVGIYFLLANSNEEDHIELNNQTKQFQTIKLQNFNNTNPALKFHMIDVGQADAILLQMSPDGDFQDYSNTYNIMIDSGDYKVSKNASNEIYTPSFSSTKPNKLKSYLDYYKINDDLIDLFVFSHADSDHIGSSDELLQTYAKPKTSLVINFGSNNKTTQTYLNLLNTIKSMHLIYLDPLLETTLTTSTFINSGIIENCEIYDLNPNQKIIEFTTNNWFSFIAPSYDYKLNQDNETNESSINNYLMWNDYRFLFSGDSEGTTHDDLINTLLKNPDTSSNNRVIPVDFYKVAHHGSTTNKTNNPHFLKQILKQDTKLLVSHNDNKLFNNKPTFNNNFMNNLINTEIDLNKPCIYSTQDVGDIIIEITNDVSVTTINRLKQQELKWWSYYKITTNHAKVFNDYLNYFY